MLTAVLLFLACRGNDPQPPTTSLPPTTSATPTADTGPKGDTGRMDTGAATGDTSGTGTPETMGVAPSVVTVGPWSPCSMVPGSVLVGAECAVALLPLDHDDPEGATLQALVKRLPAEGGETGQLWVLHGGPGASAVDDLAGLAAGLPARRPDLGYYAIDHRGIGGTARLSCPEAEDPLSDEGAAISIAEWDDCITHLLDTLGDDLAHYNTTASARDVGSLIAELVEPDADLFVFGGSYGTYLAQRYMALFPEQADGIILDGIQPADRSFVGYDGRMNDAARELFDRCASDPSCAEHFDGDPWAVAESMVASLDEGHCAVLGLDSAGTRGVLGYLTLYHPLRDLVPALVHRLDRCNGDDIQVVIRFFGGLFAPSAAPPRFAPFGMSTPYTRGNDGAGRSSVLGLHISLSELWGPFAPPTLVEVEEELDAFTMALGTTAQFAATNDRWPAFPTDRWHGVVPAYDGPVLMLQGELDSATQFPQALAMEGHYAGPAQTFAAFPHGAHGLLLGTPLPDGTHCAEHITVAFLDDPQASPDLSCIAETLPPDFDGDPAYAVFLFGSTDVWGDGPR